MAKDPVCGREVDDAAVRAGGGRSTQGAAVVTQEVGTRRFYNDRWYYFCSIDCRLLFIDNPEKYA